MFGTHPLHANTVQTLEYELLDYVPSREAGTSWTQLPYFSINCKKYFGVGFIKVHGCVECVCWRESISSCSAAMFIPFLTVECTMQVSPSAYLSSPSSRTRTWSIQWWHNLLLKPANTDPKTTSRRALLGTGPCTGKNLTKTFWKKCLPHFFPCIGELIKATAFRLGSEEKQMLGMGVLQHRVVLYLCSYHCLWDWCGVLQARGSAAHPQCPELPGSPLPTQCHFLDLWAICSAQPLLPWLITLLSVWITALYFLCLSLKYLWFHILSEEIYKRRALLKAQMMMEKECVATNSCRSLYWIPCNLSKCRNIGREWTGWGEWRARRSCTLWHCGKDKTSLWLEQR